VEGTRDLGVLAEIACGATTVADYEREVLAIVQDRVGFDVAFFKRADGLGPVMPGFDPSLQAKLAPRWPVFAEETRDLAAVAPRQGGVVVDAELFGRRLERLSYYQELMVPHRGRSTALLFARRRGAVVATLVVGRCTPTFRARELDYLRAIGPTIALCEATVHVRAPLEHAPPPCLARTLTPREHEVLGYLHLGYTNEQIARALGSAPRTVRNQLSSAYAKLGVATRAEAVSVARSLGLAHRLTDPPAQLPWDDRPMAGRARFRSRSLA
jgi:DNA-binding CsgD family transcriptional regulator